MYYYKHRKPQERPVRRTNPLRGWEPWEGGGEAEGWLLFNVNFEIALGEKSCGVFEGAVCRPRLPVGVSGRRLRALGLS